MYKAEIANEITYILWVSMWTGRQVERALSQWWNWRRSVIQQWLNADSNWETLSLNQLRSKAKNELRGLELMPCIRMQVYWICCAVSDYFIDDSSSYRNICMPEWLWSRYSEIPEYYSIELEHAGGRVYPPAAWTAQEGNIGVDADRIDFQKIHVLNSFTTESQTNSFLGLQDSNDAAIRSWETYNSLSIFSNHELYGILKGIKGRPQEGRKKRGREARYSDRWAVRCATLKDKTDMTNDEIARKFNLPTKRYFFSNQSDAVRHLVERGRVLLESVGLRYHIRSVIA